jgi:hypothetical protein
MKRRKKKLHPILIEIKRKEREIATLRRSAKMLGVDLSPLDPPHPAAKKWPKHKAEAYHRDMADAYNEPIEIMPKPEKLFTL